MSTKSRLSLITLKRSKTMAEAAGKLENIEAESPIQDEVLPAGTQLKRESPAAKEKTQAAGTKISKADSRNENRFPCRPFWPCQGTVFLFNRKLRSLLNKNAPRRSHCGGKENVAFATRRRRRILQSRILSYASVPACRLLRHGRQGKNKKWQKEIQR